MDYDQKSSDYYSNIRKDLIDFLGSSNKQLKVLEIGAAYGSTLFELKKQGIANEIVGIDLFEDKANKDRYCKLDRFIFGDIENLDFPEFASYFDLILLPDVLEHLSEPQLVLKKVSNYLKKEGQIVVSMPNIRHYTSIKKIFFQGDFAYEESGIFDYTHKRFYCRKNISDLIDKSGFKVIKQEGSIKNYTGKSIAKIINKLTFGVFVEFLSTQYYFLSVKK